LRINEDEAGNYYIFESMPDLDPHPKLTPKPDLQNHFVFAKIISGPPQQCYAATYGSRCEFALPIYGPLHRNSLGDLLRSNKFH
jgi:hypothetical protein